MCPMMAPMTAPQTFRVIRKPINAPINLPFQAIRADLSHLPRHNRLPSAVMVAVGSTPTHGTVFAINAAIREPAPQPEKNSPRKGARYLRGRCGSPADRYP